MKVGAVDFMVLGAGVDPEHRRATLLYLDEPTPLWDETQDRLWIAGKEHDFGYAHVFGQEPKPGLPLGAQWIIWGCHDCVGATVLRREGARAKAEAEAEERSNAEMASQSWNGGPCAVKVADCVPVHRPGKGYLTALHFDVPVPTEGVTLVQVGGREHEFAYEEMHGGGKLHWPPMGIVIEGLHDLEGATAYFR